jgi:hypothetical protein
MVTPRFHLVITIWDWHNEPVIEQHIGHKRPAAQVIRDGECAPQRNLTHHSSLDAITDIAIIATEFQDTTRPGHNRVMPLRLLLLRR